MTKVQTVCAASALLAMAALWSADAAAQQRKPPKPTQYVKLQIESPSYKKDQPLPIVFADGWPLVFRAEALSQLGIYTPVNLVGGAWTPAEYTGAIVFTDPDNCIEILHWPPNPQDCLSGQASPPIPDEIHMPFTVDNDAAGQLDVPRISRPMPLPGDPVARARLANPALSGEPVIAPSPTDAFTVSVGPNTGGSVNDGYGYGADDDFPGLVVLIPTGVGNVHRSANNPAAPGAFSLDLATPRRQRNLAGFLDWVNYELKTRNGFTAVNAGMTVPLDLATPIAAYDSSLAGDDSRTAVRIDGGPLQTLNIPFFSNQQGVLGESFAQTFTVRAFVVSGLAPSELTDLNGNGVVGAEDATLAGYTVISNEETVQLRILPPDPCANSFTLNQFGYDLDGDGSAPGGGGCPAGAGAIKTIPQ